MKFQNPFSKLKLFSSAAQNDTLRVIGFFVLFAAIVFVVWIYGFQGVDWEALVAKHYWNSQWYYGGYADKIEKTPQEYRSILKEGLPNYLNLFPFSEKKGPTQPEYHVEGWPSTERLAIPFLVYLIIGITRGYLNVWDVFYVLNIAIWLSSVFFAYQLAALYFEDQASPFFAALFLVFYPAFTLHFHGVKISYLNTTFLLLGIFLFEKKICHFQPHLQFVYFLAIFFLGLFAAGGWMFLFVYLFIRHFNLPQPQRWQGIVGMILAVLAAQIALWGLRQLYHLPSAEQQMSFSYGKMLSDSLAWLQAWAHGQDVAALKLLNYIGFTLFTGYLPVILRSFALGHWVFLLLSIPAWIFVPRTRMFHIAAIFLFAAGHGGYIVIGWVWHYGYLSAPAATMLILAVSGFLGWMVSRPQPYLKFLAVLLLIVGVSGFMDHKLHAGLYYGGYIERYQSRIILHYGESNDVTEY